MNEYYFTFGTGASLYFGRGFCFRCMICLFDRKLFVRNKLLVFFLFYPSMGNVIPSSEIMLFAKKV